MNAPRAKQVLLGDLSIGEMSAFASRLIKLWQSEKPSVLVINKNILPLKGNLMGYFPSWAPCEKLIFLPRRGQFPLKQGSVACAYVAKTPNRKSDCVNRPAEGFSSRHPTPRRSFASVATKRERQRSRGVGREGQRQRWGREL
jgi:hypothetical protein